RRAGTRPQGHGRAPCRSAVRGDSAGPGSPCWRGAGQEPLRRGRHQAGGRAPAETAERDPPVKWQISGRKAVSGVETSEPGMAAPVPEVAASDAEIDRYLALKTEIHRK